MREDPTCHVDETLGAGFIPVGGEGAEGEESTPEASFGLGVVQGGGKCGEPEAYRALCPGKPRPFAGFGESCSGERVARSVYGAGGICPERHKNTRLQGEYLL